MAPVPAAPSLVKLVETVCTYNRESPSLITGKQRTSTFVAAESTYTDLGVSLADVFRSPAAARTSFDTRVYDLEFRRSSVL